MPMFRDQRLYLVLVLSVALLWVVGLVYTYMTSMQLNRVEEMVRQVHMRQDVIVTNTLTSNTYLPVIQPTTQPTTKPCVEQPCTQPCDADKAASVETSKRLMQLEIKSRGS